MGDGLDMRVAAINDLSGFGKCSLIADIGVLSSMGHEVCPVPTAILSAQTGFPNYHIQNIDGYVENCKDAWVQMDATFDAILTGYMPDSKMVDDVISFVESFRKKDTILLVDPVMGDGGQCYSNYSDEMLNKIRKLSLDADVLTPNLTELCLIGGYKADKKMNIDDIVDAAKNVRKNEMQSIVVTGIHLEKDEICNLVVSADGTEMIRCNYNGLSYSGTGDLFAAFVLGNILNGQKIIESVSMATDFISNAISVTTTKDRNYGVDFEKVLSSSRGGEKKL